MTSITNTISAHENVYKKINVQPTAEVLGIPTYSLTLMLIVYNVRTYLNFKFLVTLR